MDVFFGGVAMIDGLIIFFSKHELKWKVGLVKQNRSGSSSRPFSLMLCNRNWPLEHWMFRFLHSNALR